MSASRFAPEDFNVLDLGNVPDIVVDGLAYFGAHGGVVRAVYYANQPNLPGHYREEGSGPAFTRVASLKLIYSLETHRLMQRQLRGLGDPVNCAPSPIFD